MELIAIGSMALAALSLLIPMQNNFQHIIVVGVLLLIPGALGKYYIYRIKKREEVYPGFLRFMGSNLSTDMPLMNVISEASETDFGVLNSPIKGLYNRLRMRVEPRIAWWSFETELDSQLIRRMNLILTDTVYTGGNLTEASKFLEDFSHIYTTIRRRRYAAASYHTGIMLPLYYVMAGMFATLDGFFSALEGFMSKVSTMVPFLSPPPVGFMKFFFMFALVLFALNNVFSLYNIEGDSRFTIMFFMGLQLALGGIIYLTISTAVVGYLSGIAML
jgi:archaellum biogenesis protein FlaJ (TadC family)